MMMGNATIKLFDSNGMEIMDWWHDGDNNRMYRSEAGGTYYIGISGGDNFYYDPNTEGSGSYSTGFFGNYTLNIETIGRTMGDEEPNDTLTNATDTGLTLTNPGTYTFNGEIGDNTNILQELDVDLFKFELDIAEEVNFSLPELFDENNSSNGQATVRLFDSNGNEMAWEPGTKVDTGKFSTYSAGTFSLGISGGINTTYDPNTEGSGSSSFFGSYDLTIETTTTEESMSNLVISGVIDGPLPGGTPKAIEFYVLNDIPDLSIYGVGSANNGGGTDGQEFTFSGSATAGEYIYLATETTEFNNFFGFNPDYTHSAANINGDDAIELFLNGSVVDTFGEINLDGTGQPWEYLDGWAYRNNGTGPDGTSFEINNWSFSNPNALDGESNNDTAGTPFPVGMFVGGNPIPGLNLTETDGSTDVTEGGSTDTYEIVLNTQATSDVTVDFTVDAQLKIIDTITFTTANWDTPQTITVEAEDDTDEEGNHTSTIGHSVSSSDGDYSGISVDSVTVNITDNDSAYSGEPVRFDFNSDGVADILWRNSTTGANRIWLMNSDGTRNSNVYPGAFNSDFQAEAVADFDGDKTPDIFWRNYSTGANHIWLINSDGTVKANATPEALNTNFQVEAVVDFDGDASSDIFWRNRNTGAHRIWLMNSDGTRKADSDPGRFNTDFQVEAAADFNGDETPDILWRNPTTGANRIWLMNSDGTRNSNAYPGPLNTNYQVEAAADFNGDTTPDIFWRNPTTGANRIWLMNSDGTRNSNAYPGTLSSDFQVEVVANFNGDTTPDIFWRNPTTGDNQIWLMNSDGTPLSVVNPGNFDSSWAVIADV